MNDSGLQNYINAVRQIPLLTREQEKELAVKAKSGDKKAEDKLIQSNMRFVISTALKYNRYSIPLADLIAEGSVGLVTAARKFDPEKGVRFVTYAGYWIRAFILDAVVKSRTLVSPSAGPFRSKIFFKLRRELARARTKSDDRLEQNKHIAQVLDVSMERAEELRVRVENHDVSLDTPLGNDSQMTLQDTLESELENPEDAVVLQDEQMRLGKDVERAMEHLDEREHLIMTRRHLSDEGASLAELGRELGVSRERARQLESRAKQKLKRRLDKVVAG